MLDEKQVCRHTVDRIYFITYGRERPSLTTIRLKPSTNHQLPNSDDGLIKPAVFEKISIISSEYIIILGIYYIKLYASTSKTKKN